MKKPRLRVTDHAVLRYLERVGGFDIEGLRLDIARRLEPAAQAGASAITIEGFTYCVVQDPTGPVIATVLIRAEGHGAGRRRGEDRGQAE
jgi:hypothetical protein